jgi:hypothetical protein
MLMTPLEEFLMSIGANVSSDFIYDVLKVIFLHEKNPTRETLKKKLESELKIEGCDIFAEPIINFLAKNGDIIISGSNTFAPTAIFIASSKGTSFQLKNSTTSETTNTSIKVNGPAKISGKNGATIRQTKEGIDFIA